MHSPICLFLLLAVLALLALIASGNPVSKHSVPTEAEEPAPTRCLPAFGLLSLWHQLRQNRHRKQERMNYLNEFVDASVPESPLSHQLTHPRTFETVPLVVFDKEMNQLRRDVNSAYQQERQVKTAVQKALCTCSSCTKSHQSG